MLERGEIDSCLTLANLDAEPAGGFDLDDFNTSLVDVVYYIKDEYDGDLLSTQWYPKCTINSITLNLSDPQARITRDLDLGSDDRRILTGDNKFLIHKEDTAGSGVAGNHVISLSDPAPVVDPNIALTYILRVDRTRAGVTTSLTLTTDYTYSDATKDLTIIAGLTDDVFNVYYSAASFGTAEDPTSVDTDTICFLKTENVTILIDDGTTEVEMDELSSLTLTMTMNRINENVLGNDERILQEISDSPVTVDFTGRVIDYQGEQAFMNQLDGTAMISSVKLFNTNIKVSVKIFDSAEKDTFLIGYQVDNLSYNNGSFKTTANDFSTMDVSCESDDVLITSTEGDL